MVDLKEPSAADVVAAPGLDGAGLRNQVIVVAGGASGIGAATVRLLSRRGARVVCIDRDQERSRAVLTEIDGRADDAIAIRADVTDDESVSRAFDEAFERWGCIH